MFQIACSIPPSCMNYCSILFKCAENQINCSSFYLYNVKHGEIFTFYLKADWSQLMGKNRVRYQEVIARILETYEIKCINRSTNSMIHSFLQTTIVDKSRLKPKA